MTFETETELQTYTNGLLDRLNIHYVHISSKSSRYLRKGILDNMCWVNGISFIIELKIKTVKLKPEQIKEIEKFKAQKIMVFVCRNDDEVLEAVKTMILRSQRVDAI